MLVRPATRQDLEAFYGRGDFPTARALVGVIADEVVAVAGVSLRHGRRIVFADINESVDRNSFSFRRAAVAAIRFVQKAGFDAAFANPNESTAPHLLQRVGLERLGPSEHGDFYEVKR